MPAEEPRVGLARQWLLAAEEDVALGHRSLADPAYPRGAAFHAQQAAEKALKAFLAWHDRPLRRTHDLPALLRECASLQGEFTALEDAARELTPYAITGRYPDVAGSLVPGIEQARAALRLAQEIVDFVLDRLPPDVRL
jgi:HEPN domain-containing protein